MKFNWGTGIALVYAVFALATIGFVVFAMDQPVELVSADYYEQGLRQDEHAAASARGQALGAHFQLQVASDGRDLLLRWDAARPDEATGSVVLYRPSDSRADRRIGLRPDRDGVQRIALDDLASGRWIAEVRWRFQQQDYLVARAVMRP